MRVAVIDNTTERVTGISQVMRLGEIFPGDNETLVLTDSYRELRSVSDSDLLKSFSYDISRGVWTPDVVPVPLEEAQADKTTEIKSRFNSALYEGLTTSSGIKLDADFDSISRLTALRSLAELAGMNDLSIRDFNNVTHAVTLLELNGMLIELGVNTQVLYKKKWDLQDAVNSAATTAEVIAINW